MRKQLSPDQVTRLAAAAAEEGFVGARWAVESNVPKSVVYRELQRIRGADAFQAPPATGYATPGRDQRVPELKRGDAFKEFGSTGLARFGGSVFEDYDRKWRSLTEMVKLVKEMLDHPIVAAVMFAVEMSMRGVEWTVEAGGETPADEEAAEFLRQCMEDMAHSWDDHVSQALAFVPYGFAPFEIVYKRRKGGDTDPASKYDDGRVGWRKFAFRAQDTLTPGDEWVFDEHGGVAALNQSPPPDYRRVTVPVEKLILYRSTAAKNNPQGRSVLRAAYVPWYYSKNMQEIEGISAERMGSGFPVVYLGEGTKKVGANSDFESAKVVVRDVRSDEQSGIVFPYQKQGADGKGILFELVSPPSRGAVDFNQIINRYNQQIGQVVLSQFIFLGLTEQGTQALAVRLTDLFSAAVSAWLGMMAETLNRFVVPRLFRLNAFDGLTDYPRFVTGQAGQVDVGSVVSAMAQAAGSSLLVPDTGVEAEVRRLLQLPEKPVQVQQPTIPGEPTTPVPAAPPDVEATTGDSTADNGGDNGGGKETASERFYSEDQARDEGGKWTEGGGGSGEGGNDRVNETPIDTGNSKDPKWYKSQRTGIEETLKTTYSTVEAKDQAGSSWITQDGSIVNVGTGTHVLSALEAANRANVKLDLTSKEGVESQFVANGVVRVNATSTYLALNFNPKVTSTAQRQSMIDLVYLAELAGRSITVHANDTALYGTAVESALKLLKKTNYNVDNATEVEIMRARIGDYIDLFYSEDQTRDESGKWTSGGGGGGKAGDDGAASDRRANPKLAGVYGPDPKTWKPYKDELKRIYPDAKVGRTSFDERELLGEYVGGEAYTILNGNARAAEADYDLSDDVRMMDGIFGKLGVSTEDVVVYRGLKGTPGGDLKIGAVIADKGFMSTTFNPGVAAAWTETSNQGWIMEIVVPAGNPGIPIDRWLSSAEEMETTEAELLLPRNTPLEVQSVDVETRTLRVQVVGP